MIDILLRRKKTEEIIAPIEKPYRLNDQRLSVSTYFGPRFTEFLEQEGNIAHLFKSVTISEANTAILESIRGKIGVVSPSFLNNPQELAATETTREYYSACIVRTMQPRRIFGTRIIRETRFKDVIKSLADQLSLPGSESATLGDIGDRLVGMKNIAIILLCSSILTTKDRKILVSGIKHIPDLSGVLVMA